MNKKEKQILINFVKYIINIIGIIYGCYLFEKGSTGSGLFILTMCAISINQELNNTKP